MGTELDSFSYTMIARRSTARVSSHGQSWSPNRMRKKPKRVPYYRIIPSFLPLGNSKWRCYRGYAGCVPLITRQTVSYERLAPGEAPPPPPPKPTPEQLKAQQLEEARQKRAAAQQDKGKAEAAPKDKAPEEAPIGEEVEKLPPFDIQDIPGAMKKMGWPVSAKFLERWFSSPAYVISEDDKNTGRPIDDSTITLDWVLKFGQVRSLYDELLHENISNKDALSVARGKIEKYIKEVFLRERRIGNFSTAFFLEDLQKFHKNWQFQFIDIKAYHANEIYLIPTDMTGSVGSCALYVAIGNVTVTGPIYYVYNNANGIKRWCMEPKAQITHVYVYLRDIYEFNDDKRNEKRSQYLGHWNKSGMIVTNLGIISEFDRRAKMLNPDLAKYPAVDFNVSGTEYPVDTRSGWQKFVRKNVYWSVFNRNFNEWRKQHNRGGDFMIFTKPVLVKLKKPIELALEKLCGPEEKMY